MTVKRNKPNIVMEKMYNSIEESVNRTLLNRIKYSEVRSKLLSSPILDTKEILDSYDEYLSDDDRFELEHERFSPIRFFGQLVSNPINLLVVMRDLKVVLSGPMALSHFYPGLAIDDASWDFYCANTVASVCSFWYYLSQVGVEWAGHDNTSNSNINVIYGTMQQNTKNLKVRLFWSQLGYSTPSYLISKCQNTIGMYFLSGFAAVSWYDIATSNKLCISWENSHGINIELSQDTAKLFGLRFSKYEEYDKLTNNYRNTRNSADACCKVLPFKAFLRDKLYDQYTNNLKYIKWTETPQVMKHCNSGTTYSIEYYNEDDPDGVDEVDYIGICLPMFLLESDDYYYRIMEAELTCEGISNMKQTDQFVLGQRIKRLLTKKNNDPKASIVDIVDSISWINLLVSSDVDSQLKYSSKLPC